MRREEISFIRRAVKDYYETVKKRAVELEREMPIYEYLDISNPFWGGHRIYVYHGSEMRAPAGLRSELSHLRKELNMWMDVSPEDEA